MARALIATPVGIKLMWKFLSAVSGMSSCLVNGYIQRFCGVCIVGIDTQNFAQFYNSILQSAESA